jgi:hypothetical protein
MVPSGQILLAAANFAHSKTDLAKVPKWTELATFHSPSIQIKEERLAALPLLV